MIFPDKIRCRPLIVKRYLRQLMLLAVMVLGFGQALGAEDAATDEKKYVIESNGHELLVDAAAVNRAELAGGQIRYWLELEPQSPEVKKGALPGIYFFNEAKRFISRLELEGATGCLILFNPNGEKFIRDCGEGQVRDLNVYKLDGLEKIKHFRAFATGWSWLNWLDDEQFVFTLIDNAKKRSEESELPGWASVAVYDSAKDELTIVAAATATEDYVLNDFDREGRKLLVERYQVKNSNDWVDQDKIDNETISLPLVP